MMMNSYRANISVTNENIYIGCYPFGSLMPGRHASSGDYRYGFNGQETEPEVKGEGNSLNYKFRMYDPRISRFFAVDPITSKLPMLTPYQHSSLNPIWNIELEGLEGVKYDRMIANQVAPKLGITTQEFLNQTNPLYKAAEFVRESDVSFSVEGEITFGPQVGAEVEVGGAKVAVFANAGAATIVAGKADYRSSSGVLIGSGNYIGKDGKVKVKGGADVGIGIVSIGGEYSFDGLLKGGSENETIKGDVGIGVLKLSKQKNLSTGEVNSSMGSSVGFKAAVGIGVEIKMKLEATDTKQDSGINLDNLEGSAE